MTRQNVQCTDTDLTMSKHEGLGLVVSSGCIPVNAQDVTKLAKPAWSEPFGWKRTGPSLVVVSKYLTAHSKVRPAVSCQTHGGPNSGICWPCQALPTRPRLVIPRLASLPGKQQWLTHLGA